MLRNITTKRWLVAAVGLVAAGVFVGGVIGARLDTAPSAEHEAALRNDAAVRVAELPATRGLPAHSVFVQSTSTGLLCLWDTVSSSPLERRGGCNSADDPLGGRKLTMSLAYEGGPGVGDVTDARLFGLVSFEASGVQVLMSDGSRRTIPMRRDAAVASDGGRFRAFVYRFPESDFRRGISPTAVLAVDAQGAEIDRLTTGYGG
jgi:hypothetical protein